MIAVIAVIADVDVNHDFTNIILFIDNYLLV